MAINDKPFGSSPNRVLEHGAHAEPTPVDPMHELIENWFVHHAPQGDEAQRYEAIRAIARTFAHTLVQKCPPSVDRTHAIRCLREVVMWANASIACGGK